MEGEVVDQVEAGTSGEGGGGGGRVRGDASGNLEESLKEIFYKWNIVAHAIVFSVSFGTALCSA